MTIEVPNMAPLVDVRVFGTPRPKGSYRPFVTPDGKARVREQHGHSTDWRSDVIAALRRVIGCGCPEPDCAALRPGYPYLAAVEVVVALQFTPPKKRTVAPSTRSTGDVDKHARNILDALQDAGVIKDDAQVVDLRIAKRYAEAGQSAGARILVWPYNTATWFPVKTSELPS